MTFTKTWTIEAVPPLDFYDEFTLTVEEYVTGGKGLIESEDNKSRAEKFLSAFDAIKNDSRKDSEFRSRFGVLYDPNTDDVAFIFKLDNNGTTLIASENGMIKNPDIVSIEKIEGTGDLDNDSQLAELKDLGISEFEK